MSTLAYAQLTNKRDAAPSGTSQLTSPPGVKTYVDALAALVPSELLTLHALIVAATTSVAGPVTTIDDLGTLKVAFYGLLVLGCLIYAIPRVLAGQWDTPDWARS